MRAPPPPKGASTTRNRLADASPGEGAIRMGQHYHYHTKCYTPGAAVSVMSSGKPHQSQYLQTWSCGLVHSFIYSVAAYTPAWASPHVSERNGMER